MEILIVWNREQNLREKGGRGDLKLGGGKWGKS